MVRKSGNLRGNSIMVEKAYEYLQKVGAKTTREIKDNVNFYTKIDGTPSKHSWSMHQYAQTLRTHPLFKCVGDEKVTGTYGKTTTIKKYDIVPLEVVVDRILSAKHNLIRRDNLIPMLRKAIEEKEKEKEMGLC